MVREKGLGVSFSQTFGIDHVYGGPDFQNQRGDGYMSGYANYKSSGNMQDTNSFYLNGNGDRSVAWGGGVSWGPKFDGQPIEFYDYTTVNYSPIRITLLMHTIMVLIPIRMFRFKEPMIPLLSIPLYLISMLMVIRQTIHLSVFLS